MIHGGGYVVGSAADALQNAASLSGLGDVIVVGFNYRLGIFGFADMKELAPGNLGLRDQRLALQWIQDNIADFGGDPDQVTVIGVSAGSMSVAAQIITPIDDKANFRSAVLDAGVIKSNGFFEEAESSYTRVKKIAKKIGCPVDSSELVSCLRKASVKELLPLSLTTTGNTGISFFVATSDGKFIPRDVEDYVERNSAKLRKVRTMIGYAKDEGGFFVHSNFMLQDFPNPTAKEEVLDYIADLSVKYDHPIDAREERTRKLISELYVDKHPEKSFDAVSAFQADGVFKCPINNFVRSYSRHNDQVYVYQFERKLQQTYSNVLSPDELGVFHYSPYLHFVGVLLFNDASDPVKPGDKLFSLDAVNMISNFAKSDQAPSFRGLQWPSYSESKKILIFNETPSLGDGLSSERSCLELFTIENFPRTKKSRTEL